MMIIWLEWANFVVAWPGESWARFHLEKQRFGVDPELNCNPACFWCPPVMSCGDVGRRRNGTARTQGLLAGSAWYSIVVGTVIPVIILVGFAIASLWSAGPPPAMDASRSAIFRWFRRSEHRFHLRRC